MLTLSTEIDSKLDELLISTRVTQKFLNKSKKPIELKIYIYKLNGIIFSSFSAKIGDSISVESKVIKKEKAEEKYNDIITSGNSAIFVCDDPYNKDRFIINIGNLPPKQELIFVSKFIQYVNSSDKYEFELFRNLPIFVGINDIFINNSIKGKAEIIAKNIIKKVEKKILSDKIKILEEKFLKENYNKYLIAYEYDKDISSNLYFYLLNHFSLNKVFLEYIPSSKILFDIIKESPIEIFVQKSSLADETNYIIQYRNYDPEIDKNVIREELEINPSLFIFLLDQSGSMLGKSIEIACQALLLFLQSLPFGSYYQIIGFGSIFKKYDITPKEYTKSNILESQKLISQLSANLGGTDIYALLKDIYESKDYDNIKLPKNIFLLTDGEIKDKKETLDLIEKNSNEFFIYSIGIGERFDEDLIKNAGVIGKGNYNFCKDINGLKEVIAKEVNNASMEYYTDFIIKSENLSEKDNNINVLRKNKIYNFEYIIKGKNIIDQINIELSYKNKKSNEIIKENYQITPIELPEGEELSKLIMNNYISNINKEEDKIQLALNYKLLTEYTSLFAEIKFSEKITEEMKLKILGNKKNNIILKNNSKKYSSLSKKKMTFNFGFFDAIGDAISSIGDGIKNIPNMIFSSKNKTKEIENENKIKINNFKIKEEERKIKKIIDSQDFIDGSWELNDDTEIIKNKYEKEFQNLKKLRNKDINDKIAITILIIYFINKEHSELLNELIMIIKKAKLFIQKNTKDTYENIIKEIEI